MMSIEYALLVSIALASYKLQEPGPEDTVVESGAWTSRIMSMVKSLL